MLMVFAVILSGWNMTPASATSESATSTEDNPLPMSEGFDVESPFTVVKETPEPIPHFDTMDGEGLSVQEITTLLAEEDQSSSSSTEGISFMIANRTRSWHNPSNPSDPNDIDVMLTSMSYVPDAVVDVIHESFMDYRSVIDIDLPEPDGQNQTAQEHIIEVTWSYGMSNGTLAGAQTTWSTVYQNGTWYRIPKMLSDTLSGTNSTGTAAIKLYINANVSWDYSMNPTDEVSNSSYYLKTILLHELGHGIGVASATTNESSVSSAAPSMWDTHLHASHDVDKPFTLMRNSIIKKNDMWFQNTDGTWEKVYDPSSWATGSSLGHLDENSYLYIRGWMNTPGSLMTPFLSNGEVTEVDGVIAGLLNQVGYTTFMYPLAPTYEVSYVDGMTTVAFVPKETGASNVPAKEWEVAIKDSDGNTIVGAIVPATERTMNINWELTEESYQIVVSAITDGNKNSSSSSFSTIAPATTTTMPVTTTTVPVTTTVPAPVSTTTTVPVTTTMPVTTTTVPSTTEAPYATTPTTVEPPVAITTPSTVGAPKPTPTTVNRPTTTVVTPAPIKVGPLNQATNIAEIIHAYDYESSDADVLRLYRAFFNREPDVTGAKYWLGAVTPQTDYDELAWGFANSTEFISTYGDVSDREFLLIVYSNVLGRTPDNTGFDYWATQMDKGLERHEVVRWIASGGEFSERFPYAP